MFRAVTWLLAGGPLQPGLGWRRHGRFGAPGRLHFLMGIAALAVCLLPASVAHAQGAAPTVSTVAITSDPGTDDTYATGDTITVTVTFSEAVTVTGTPRITLDIGGQPRYAGYSGDGTSAAAQAFSYTALVSDQDADGVSVLANSLALDGGTILATDDSAAAALAHSAMSFADHKVDTEVVLVSNLRQTESSDTVTISASESYSYVVTANVNASVGLSLSEVTLDVKTPSDTLDVTVRAVSQNTDYQVYTYTGSVATAGLRTFTLDTLGAKYGNLSIATRASSLDFQLLIEASGTGTVELAGTTTSAEDTESLSGWNLSFPGRLGGVAVTIPKIRLEGYPVGIPYLLYGDVISSPRDGTAYTAGERIEILFVFSKYIEHPEIMSVPLWLGAGAQRQREAMLVSVTYTGTLGSAYLYAYTVESQDADNDGIYIPANPFGDNEDADIALEGNSSIPADALLAENQLGSSQAVDGSDSLRCQDVLCTGVVIDNLAGRGFNTQRSETYLPYSPLVRSNGVSFRYGDEEYLVVFLDLYTDVLLGNNLQIYVLPEVPDDVVSRWIFTIDGTVFHASEAVDPTSVLLQWRNPGLTWAANDEIDFTIIETATASFGEATYMKTEGDTFDVTVNLDEAFEVTTVTVPVTVTPNGGATEADYSGIPENLVFAPGEASKTFTVTVFDDTEDDDDESVTLSFGEENHIRAGVDNQTTTITLTDNDDPAVTVEFGQDSQGVGEGESVNVTISLSADPERTVTIPIVATPQGTASAADYSVPTSVTFNEGDTEKTIAFMATPDDDDDDDETVKLTFGSTLPPRVTEGTRTETTLNIGDDDDPTVTVTFGASAYTVAEGATQQVTVTVSADPERTIIIPITATPQGTASAADYSLPPSVNFTDGASQVFTFTARQDLIDDDNESVKLGFGTMPDPRVSAGTEAEATVTITDDDTADIVLNPTSMTLTEGDAEGASYTVSLATEPTVEVTVTVTVTGHAGTDLTLSGPTLSNDALTFTAADWNTPQTVTVTAAHDDDDDDTATLTHTSAGGEYDALTRDLQVTVEDNTGNLRLVDGTLTDPGNAGALSEGRLEIFYNGEWCTICDDYWGRTDDNQDVACRQLGFVGGSVEDHDRFRNSYFPPGTRDQTIALDDVRCLGNESNLLECPNRGWEVHNCRHAEDVGIRCIQNSAGAYVTNMEISAPPGANEKYDVGETVTVTLVWSEAVNVDVTPPVPPSIETYPPRLQLFYGNIYGRRTKAVYTSGTGTPRTVFTATVEDRGNAHYDRIGVVRESLTTEIWNVAPGPDPVGSYITSVSTGDPATLKHPDYRSAEVGMQAEAVTIPGVPTFKDPGEDNVFGPGETVEVTFAFSQPVQVDITGGTPSVEVLLSGTDAKEARYVRGSGTGQLVFGYTLTAGDGEHNSLLVDPNSLRLNGGAIRDVANNLDAATQHQGGGTVFQSPPDETAPQLQSAAVNGSGLTLAYDEELENANTLSSNLFAVNVNGASRPVRGVAVGQSNVTLLLSPEVVAGDTVTVDYTAPTDAGTARVQDLSGNAALSFSGQAVTNDTAPPQTPIIPDDLRVTRHESGKLLASWTAPGSGPAPTGYTVQWKESGNDWADQDYVWGVGVTGASHIITGLTDGTEYAVRVIATRDGANSEPSGEVTATPKETTPPELSLASVDGATLTLTFDEALDTGNTPDISKFAVTVGGSDRGVDAVAVSGSVVTLTLATAVFAADAVTADYTVPVDDAEARLQDLAGNAAADFSGREVTNNTAPGPVPGSPTGLQVARHGSGKLVASWIAPDTGPVPTGYTVRWKESGDDWADRNDVSEAHITNGFWHIITGLTDGTEYAVRVIATRDDADSDPSEEVTVTPAETTPPELSSASVDGATLTLTFNEALDTGETPDGTAFPATVAGSGRGVDAVSVSGSVVTLTLVTAVAAGDAVTVDYTAPTGQSDARLQDLAGNAAASFSGQDVTNETTPPEAPGPPTGLQVAQHESGKLLASWAASESGPSPTGYTLQWKESGDDWADQDDVSEAVVTGTSHTITGLADGTEYAVRVISTTDGADSDPSGEVTATPRETTPPELSSASVDGATLILTFDEPLDTGDAPDQSAFTVTVAGSCRGVDAVAVSGSVITLTLVTAVAAGDAVTVDYTAPTGQSDARLQDLAGNAAPSFSGQAVTNDTAPPQTPIIPDDLRVTRHESGQLLASWNAPGSGPAPTGYTVQWKESGDDWADQDDLSEAQATGTSHVITGLTDGTEYAVRVIATTDDAGSAPSGEVTATPTETTPPELSSASVDGATLTLTFDEALDTGKAPDISNFAVVVGGSSRAV